MAPIANPPQSPDFAPIVRQEQAPGRWVDGSWIVRRDKPPDGGGSVWLDGRPTGIIRLLWFVLVMALKTSGEGAVLRLVIETVPITI